MFPWRPSRIKCSDQPSNKCETLKQPEYMHIKTRTLYSCNSQTGTFRCSVTPWPVTPSVPNETLSSIKIRTLYWCFNSTCLHQHQQQTWTLSTHKMLPNYAINQARNSNNKAIKCPITFKIKMSATARYMYNISNTFSQNMQKSVLPNLLHWRTKTKKQ